MSIQGNYVGGLIPSAKQVGARPDTWMPTADEVGAAPKSHNHAASNIISGTLSADRLPTVPITKGGLGGTDRLSSAKNLTNEAVSSPNYVVGFTSSWGKFGYTSLAQLMTALGAASATPTVKNMTNSYHRAFLVKIGKLVICVLTSRVLNSTLLYSETLTIDDSNFIPASAKTFYVYSDAGHNEALGSDVSNGGTVNVKISTDGEFKISSDYVHTVGEVCGTYWWITA